uniref:Uncharacterized protein n=1 Tax=Thermogemmatispora argillosa TaxID=2045280 RepID=A0A455T950_9CHLR|nr:hypothetical protein KTA_41700 [Thermogemmatispora argillosa]
MSTAAVPVSSAVLPFFNTKPSRRLAKQLLAVAGWTPPLLLLRCGASLSGAVSLMLQPFLWWRK